MTGRRHRARGQASLEVLAAVPLLVVAVLVGWQLVALVRGALLAQEDARARALGAAGPGRVSVEATRRVRSVLPGVGELRVRVRAVTQAP